MPLTDKGKQILSKMEEQYGTEKGKEVFYASKNAGKITGVDEAYLGDMESLKDMVASCDAFDTKAAQREEFRALIAEQREDLVIAERLLGMAEKAGNTAKANEQREIVKALKQALQRNLGRRDEEAQVDVYRGPSQKGVETRDYKRFKEQSSKPGLDPTTGKMSLHPAFAAAVEKTMREFEGGKK